MNALIGKLTGIALFLAAALIAALFAMGVFAPGDARAEVETGDKAPTAKLINADNKREITQSPSENIAPVDATGNPLAGGKKGASLIIKFEVDDDVDGNVGISTGTDSVTIRLPEEILSPLGLTAGATINTDFTPANQDYLTDANYVTIQQDGDDGEPMLVGSLTAADTAGNWDITIGPSTAATPRHLEKGKTATLTIAHMSIAADAVFLPQKIQISQADRPSALGEAAISLVNTDEIPRSPRAYLGKADNTLVVEFTPRNAGLDTVENDGDIVIDPKEDYLLRGGDSGNVKAKGLADGAMPDVDTTATKITIGEGDFTLKKKVTVTIDRVPDAKDGHEITLSQASTGYKQVLTVGGRVAPVPGEDPDEDITPGVFKPTDEDDPDASGTAKAGAEVEVTIRANAETTIGGGKTIVITLPDFGIPGRIDREDVIIDGKYRAADPDATPADAGRPMSYYGNPQSVSVSGDKITVRVPVRNNDADRSPTEITETEAGAPYEIIFLKEAGLTAPNTKGTKAITVSDGTEEDDPIMVKIDSSVSVEPKSGFVARGGDATVTAKGLVDGAATVFLLETDDGELKTDDDGNHVRGKILGTGTASDGVAEISIDTDTTDLVAGANVDPDDEDKDKGVNTLRVVDANNATVGDVSLGIKPTVKPSETAKRSTDLEISVSDWYYGKIDKVTIGGIEVAKTEGAKTIPVGSDNKETFKVTVPADVRDGEQQVKVEGDNPDDLNAYSATAKVTIVALPLDISPATAVPGQQVTITASGFENRKEVSKITIGGKEVPSSDFDDARTTSSGNIAVTVPIPMNVGNGEKQVRIDAGTRTGEGEITVPKPAIALDPAESVPGSIITVTGSGFASDGRVEVKFGKPDTTLQVEETGVADSSGAISIRLEIPSGAGVDATNTVMVQSRSDADDVDISAKADHKTPGAMITLPEAVQVGTLATISGTNFDVFSRLTVTIGGRTATPTGAETNKNGAFELQARVPRVSAGSHTVTVMDASDNTVTETFTVTAAPVVSTPQEVFAELGDKLVVVWRYDNATQSWASYSPDAPNELNDLTGVSRGENVWVQITEQVMFQGKPLYFRDGNGWNLITLE